MDDSKMTARSVRALNCKIGCFGEDGTHVYINIVIGAICVCRAVAL